jgi:hypothetical protein
VTFEESPDIRRIGEERLKREETEKDLKRTKTKTEQTSKNRTAQTNRTSTPRRQSKLKMPNHSKLVEQPTIKAPVLSIR